MKRVTLAALGWYREYRKMRPDACRYQPTCTAYAIEAVEVHGALRGLWLATRRVSRCHPFAGHGHDPVPRPSPSPPLLSSDV